MCLRFSSRCHKRAPIDYRLTWYTTLRSAIPTLRCRHAKPSDVIKIEFPIKIHYNVLNGNWFFFFNRTNLWNRTRKTWKYARALQYYLGCLLSIAVAVDYQLRWSLGDYSVVVGPSKAYAGFYLEGETFYKQRGVKIKRCSRCSWINHRPFCIK